MDQIYAQGKNNGLSFYKKQFCLAPSRILEYPIFTEIGTAINLASRFKTVLEDKILLTNKAVVPKNTKVRRWRILACHFHTEFVT